MAALLAVVQHRRRIVRRPRLFRDHSQVLDTLSDPDLIARYRFDRRIIWEIINAVTVDIQLPTERGGHVIPPHIQVLVTLRFLAKGDFLSETADLHGISRSSASRIFPKVCSSFVNHYPISYPSDQETIHTMKTKFYNRAQFPNVIGCIDGTLIPIETPYQDEPSYVCRKGYHAINVQAIVDADMRFINVVVKWPGATHDAFVLANSTIAADMEGRNLGWLLGDSGYPLKPWLMTPYIRPVGVQQRYNSAHTRTRNIVERAFGVLKARFRCLDKSGGSLSYQPRKAVKIIGACFSLHNLATEKNMPVPNHVVENNEVDNINNQQPAGRAQEIRNNLARRF